jgi:nucleoside-diphosphate-sugar epimerase
LIKNSQIQSDIHGLINSDFTNFFRGQRILITGASGLMGSYFTSLFQEFTVNFEGDVSLYLLSKSDTYPVPIYPSSVRLQIDLAKGFESNHLPQFDTIINCAGHAQPSLFQKTPLDTISINSTAVLSLLKKVSRDGSFLFFSSSEVYSGLPNPPYREIDIGTTNTNHPRSAYIESKRLGEAIICNISKEFPNLRSFAARLSLSYGPGTKPNDSRVINQFIAKALERGTIDLVDSGSALRTYCYALDALEMCLGIIMYGSEKIYNVGGESRTSIIDLANIIASKTGAKVLIPPSSNVGHVGAPADVRLDLTKIKSLIRKREFISLDEGLERTINWLIHRN